MAAFKEHVNRASIERWGRAVLDVWEAFPLASFVDTATEGLDALELKARVAHVAGAFAATAPRPFSRAAGVVRRAAERGAPWDGFDLWPVQEWVQLAGLDHPERSLTLIASLTRHASGEFAVRSFIDLHPELAKERLLAWAVDDDEHVRRLASEGSRPLLPWGRRLAVPADWAVDVLDLLHHDPSEYVRRSVANHLNDLNKVAPGVALELARRWLAEANADTERLVRHGLRTLVKQGDPRALALIGSDHAAAIDVDVFEVSPDVLDIGSVATLRLSLTSREPAPARVVVDYVVHFVGAGGRTNRRTFRWRTVDLQPGASLKLEKRHPFRDVSIRTHRPGPHHLSVQVNGTVRGSATVELRTPTAR